VTIITTAPSANLPNMLVVGAAKCGTTSLAEFLRIHPDIYMSGTKELSFFLPSEGQRIQSLEAYQACFDAAGAEPVRGEASVNYLYYEESPRLIHETLGPHVKLIIMLRNPLDMAYSLWGHNCRLERESSSFQDSLDQESSRMAGQEELIGWRPNYFYRSRATYAPQIRRYIEQFTRDNIRIILFEDMISNPTEELGDLCDWLNVSRDVLLQFPRLNPAGSNRIRSLRKWMDGGSGSKKLLKRFFPERVRIPIRRMAERFNRTEITMQRLDHDTRASLQNLFKDDISELSGLMDRDLFQTWDPAGKRDGCT